jgi:DMSO/TMAO reductase YedYZ molybdopterin-dependent catalytic subunit
VPLISRGFRRRREDGDDPRLPPGQYWDPDFPVLTVGPTPRVTTGEWDFRIDGAVVAERRWTWDEMLALGPEDVTCDIHCVTKWSKRDTLWQGIPLDRLLAESRPTGVHVLAWCDGGYTTDLQMADVTDGRAWLAVGYEGGAIPAEHGGPARLLVPHLYFWKSAKWVRGLTILAQRETGFWERNGYHHRGDPFREERYEGD